jgi:hypothetical protein
MSCGVCEHVHQTPGRGAIFHRFAFAGHAAGRVP